MHFIETIDLREFDAAPEPGVSEPLTCRICHARAAVFEVGDYSVCDDVGCAEVAYRYTHGYSSELD